mgnify:CR=1 FL=1
MTVKECYEELGGDYEDVLVRLMDQSIVRKFALKFLDDPSYPGLKAALEANDAEDADQN